MSQAGGELHVFSDLMMRTTIGAATHQEWQEWAAQCTCTWDETKDADERGSHFATAETDGGVRGECSLHQVVQECCEYIALIDGDWLQIADWYRLEVRR